MSLFAALLGGGATLAFFAMTAAFFAARKVRNFSIVDVAWCVNFTLLAAMFSLFGKAPPLRRGALLLIVALWSLRLASHLAKRIADLHPVEEGRYAELRRRWNNDLDRRFFLFFQAQGLSNALLALPFLFVAMNQSPRLGVLEVAGSMLFTVGFLGESTADRQLRAFKGRERGAALVCREGLWRYSRHPNYFFEWLVWCSFAAVASSSDLVWAWLAWACPLAMLYLILNVTGVRPTEDQALRSRGAAYRDYQASTNAFIPWFPRVRGAQEVKGA